MAIEIGTVQSISTRSGDYGWGFSLRDSTARPARWCTIAYQTEAKAKEARERIKAATAHAIEIIISP
jgi:hypothetical protein